MLIRMKKTGDVIDLPSGQARDLIERGSAELVEKPEEKIAETAALDLGGSREVQDPHRRKKVPIKQ
jgi:hypothetical protein